MSKTNVIHYSTCKNFQMILILDKKVVRSETVPNFSTSTHGQQKAKWTLRCSEEMKGLILITCTICTPKLQTIQLKRHNYVSRGHIICVCGRYNTCYDWLIILGHYSPIMHTGSSWACWNVLSLLLYWYCLLNMARSRFEIFPLRPHSQLTSSWYIT